MGNACLIQLCCSQGSMEGGEKQRKKKKKKQGSSHEEGVRERERERERGDSDDVHGIGVWIKSALFMTVFFSSHGLIIGWRGKHTPARPKDYSYFPLMNELFE